MLTLVFFAIGALLSIDSVLRFVLLVLRFTVGKPPPHPDATLSGAIVLIAAHDEEGTIGPTVTSLIPHLAGWPGTELWVIADRCNDGTAEEARRCGANVALRADGRIGKGAAVDWWLANFRDRWKEKSTIVLLDADSRLASGSLRAVRNAIAGGATAAQAFVAPQAGIVAGRLAGWSEVLMQQIDDEARRRMRFSVPLRGTGSAIRANVLAELSPRLHTFAEDLELDVLLAEQAEHVDFVPDAMVIDPKPRKAAGVSRQRSRWIQGQMQVLNDYWREVLRALIGTRTGFRRAIGAWLLLPLLFLRPKIGLIALRMFGLLAALARSGVGGMRIPILVLSIALVFDFLYYAAGAFIIEDRRTYLKDLMSAPGYAAIWVYSIGVAVVRRSRSGWLRAGRD